MPVIDGEREEAAVYSRKKKMHASIMIMVNDHVLLNLFQVNRCHRISRTSSFLASKYSCLSHTSRYPFYSGWFQKIIRYVTALVSYTVNSFVHRALYLFLSRLQNNWGGNKALFNRAHISWAFAIVRGEFGWSAGEVVLRKCWQNASEQKF